MGFWQNARRLSAFAFQLRQLSDSGSPLMQNLTPLKQSLIQLINKQVDTPAPELGIVGLPSMPDLKQLIIVGLCMMPDSEILAQALWARGKLDEFLNQWTGDTSGSNVIVTHSSVASQAPAKRSLPNGLSEIDSKNTPLPMTRNTRQRSASGKGKRTSTRGRS